MPNKIDTEHILLFVYAFLMLTTLFMHLSWLATENVKNETVAIVLAITCGILYIVSLLLLLNKNINMAFGVFVMNVMLIIMMHILTLMKSTKITSNIGLNTTYYTSRLGSKTLVISYLTILTGSVGFGLHMLDPCRRIVN